MLRIVLLHPRGNVIRVKRGLRFVRVVRNRRVKVVGLVVLIAVIIILEAVDIILVVVDILLDRDI